MILIPLILSFSLIVAAYLFLVFKSRAGGDVREFLPSFAWLCLMLIPYLVQSSFFFNERTADAFWIQATGIILVFIGLAAADFFALGRFRTIESSENIRRKHMTLAGVILGFSFALWLYHVSQMPQIPLLEALWNPDLSKGDYDLMREKSSKLIDLPLWFIYLCQALLIISPVQVMTLIKGKRWITAAVSLFFILVYSRITLAKGPIYLIGITFAFLYARRVLKAAPTAAKVISAASAALVIFTLAASPLSPLFSTLVNQAQVEKLQEISAKTRLSYTPADQYRIFKSEKTYLEAPRWQRFVLDYYYRAFLVPSEVSSRWYNYFPELNDGQYIGLYGLTTVTRNRPDFEHPATTIGVWAYFDRFPDNYLKSIRAYCSADCDAYARFGIIGLLSAVIFITALRLGMVFLRSSHAYFDQYYAVGLVVLSTGLLAGSLQAIFMAQGLFILMLGLLAGRLWSRKR